MRSLLVLFLASVAFAHGKSRILFRTATSHLTARTMSPDSTGGSHTHSPRPAPSDATTDPPVIKLVLAPPTPDDAVEPSPTEPAEPTALEPSVFSVTTFAPIAVPRPPPTIKPVTLTVGDVVVNNPADPMTEESNEMEDPEILATGVPILIDIPSVTGETGDGGTSSGLVDASFTIETPTGEQTPDTSDWPMVETTLPDDSTGTTDPDETPREGGPDSGGPNSTRATTDPDETPEEGGSVSEGSDSTGATDPDDTPEGGGPASEGSDSTGGSDPDDTPEEGGPASEGSDSIGASDPDETPEEEGPDSGGPNSTGATTDPDGSPEEGGPDSEGSDSTGPDETLEEGDPDSEGRTNVTEESDSTETQQESEATDRTSPGSTADASEPGDTSTTTETPEEAETTEAPNTTEEPQSPESSLVSGSPNATEGATDTPLENTTTPTTMDPMCASHSACEALEGACCPNSSPDAAVFLSCCGTGPVQETCTDNAECSALELEGACCPTSTGVYLDCCAVVPDECGDGGECVVESALEYKALLEQQAEEAATAENTSRACTMRVGSMALLLIMGMFM